MLTTNATRRLAIHPPFVLLLSPPPSTQDYVVGVVSMLKDAGGEYAELFRRREHFERLF